LYVFYNNIGLGKKFLRIIPIDGFRIA